MKHKEKAVFVAFLPALALAAVGHRICGRGPGPLTVHSCPKKTHKTEEKRKRLGATASFSLRFGCCLSMRTLNIASSVLECLSYRTYRHFTRFGTELMLRK